MISWNFFNEIISNVVPIHPYLSLMRRVNPVVGKVIDDWNAKAVDIA